MDIRFHTNMKYINSAGLIFALDVCFYEGVAGLKWESHVLEQQLHTQEEMNFMHELNPLSSHSLQRFSRARSTGIPALLASDLTPAYGKHRLKWYTVHLITSVATYLKCNGCKKSKITSWPMRLFFSNAFFANCTIWVRRNEFENDYLVSFNSRRTWESLHLRS